ncbi:MAG: urease accessory protein UreD [Acidimicrobiales bacterium]
MDVRAELTAAPPLVAGGPCRLTRRRDGAPVAWRSTPDAVYLVATAANPVGDDRVELDLIVETGATLKIRSTAASVAWSATATEQLVCAAVSTEAIFDWRLQPLVATSGCHHRQHAIVRMEGSGSLRWTEELILGRWDEAPGDLELRLDVDLDGQPLLRHQLVVGCDAPGWDGPAVLGDRRAVGLSLTAGRTTKLPDPRSGPGWALLGLDGPGALAVAVADDLPGLRAALESATSPSP